MRMTEFSSCMLVLNFFTNSSWDRSINMRKYLRILYGKIEDVFYNGDIEIRF